MSREMWIGLCAIGFAVLLIFILIMKYLVARKHQEEDQRKSMLTNYRREVLESQVEVQKQAFERVGTELYDNIGQMLSVAKIYLYSLEESELNSEQRTYVQQTNDMLGQSITDLRGLIRQLKGCMAHEFDLQNCIKQHLLRFRKHKCINTELLITGESYSLAYEKEIVLFRVIQEVINIIFEEAEVSQLTVTLDYEPAQLIVEVESDGQVPAKTGKEECRKVKWQDIQGRTKLIGGQCTFETTTEEETKVKIEIKNP